jgi:hypothetical protein
VGKTLKQARPHSKHRYQQPTAGGIWCLCMKNI